MIKRTIIKVTQSEWHQGFLGAGHTASSVLSGMPYQESDPFILFMDDKLNLPGGEPVGGPHPHAGFETLTLVLKGNEKDWKTGSFELMTAGSGIVHTEEITSQQNLHILQVWLVLPPEKRWTKPFWQRILLENVPTLKNESYEIRVYSGESNGLVSPIRNNTPLILVDFRMQTRQTLTHIMSSEYNGLIYMLEGSVRIDDKILNEGQTGWLDKNGTGEDSEVVFESLDSNTRFVLFAALPHNAKVITHGPFVADSLDDIYWLYEQYGKGKIPHLNDLPDNQKLSL